MKLFLLAFGLIMLFLGIGVWFAAVCRAIARSDAACEAELRRRRAAADSDAELAVPDRCASRGSNQDISQGKTYGNYEQR